MLHLPVHGKGGKLRYLLLHPGTAELVTAKRVGMNIEGFGAHSLRATAATNALDHEADMAPDRQYALPAICVAKAALNVLSLSFYPVLRRLTAPRRKALKAAP